MKVILQNTNLVFKRGKRVKYHLTYSDFSEAGYVRYAEGTISLTYQKHTNMLTVAEGDIINVCVRERHVEMALIAFYADENINSYVQVSGGQCSTDKYTASTMVEHTFKVPSGVTKVVFSTATDGSPSQEDLDKIFVKVTEG